MTLPNRPPRKEQSRETEAHLRRYGKAGDRRPSTIADAEALIGLVMQLIAIDSVNPSLVPGGAGEWEIAHFVAGWLKGAGLEVRLEEAVAGRPNVVAIVRGAGGGRSLMLCAHMDTVGVAGMPGPFAPEVVGSRLYGRGANDMKGGLAVIMYVAAAARRLQLRGDLIIAAVVDEEYESLGSRSLVERWHADGAILAESTGLDVCVAHGGSVGLEIALQGVEDGEQAVSIRVLGSLLQELRTLNWSLLARGHRLLGSGSLQVSLQTGGRRSPVRQPPCVLRLKRRTVPGETLTLVESEIATILHSLVTTQDGIQASLRTETLREPFEISEDEPIVRTLRTQAAKVRGSEPPIVAAKGWMDSAILAAADIPTIVFGPGGGGAHSTSEWVDLADLPKCAEIILLTAEQFCN